MPCLSKAGLSKPFGLRTEKFPLEAEDYVCIRSLGSRDFLALQRKFADKGETSNMAFVATLLSMSLVDDDGNLLFDNAEDVNLNLNVSMELIKRLGEKALEVSGVADEKKD